VEAAAAVAVVAAEGAVVDLVVATVALLILPRRGWFARYFFCSKKLFV
jgi:hypothetical protein